MTNTSNYTPFKNKKFKIAHTTLSRYTLVYGK